MLFLTHAYFPSVADNAYACDFRIKKFKDEEKEKKLAEKKAKEQAARAAAEEKERVSESFISFFSKVAPCASLKRIVNLVSKIVLNCFCFALIRSVTSPEISRQPLIQLDARPINY